MPQLNNRRLQGEGFKKGDLKSIVLLNQLGFFSERWRVSGGSAIFSDSPDLAAAGSKALHRSDAHTLLAISVGSLRQKREGFLDEQVIEHGRRIRAVLSRHQIAPQVLGERVESACIWLSTIGRRR